ncbi:MAG: transcription-repair coupling factor [Coriobacteriia bacterium]
MTPLLEGITEALRRLPGFAAVTTAWDEGSDATVAAAASVRPMLVSALFAAGRRPTLVVVAGEEGAERTARAMRAYLGREAVVRMPERRTLPWERTAADPETVAHRCAALHALQEGTPVVVVVSARALLRKVPPFGSRACDPVRLHAGGTADLTAVTESLAHMGYERVDRATDRGQFAVRGGVLDVFPAQAPYPVRADFAGDEVETIRRYIPSTGQIVGDVEEVAVFPCREARLSTRAVRAAESALVDRAKRDDAVARDLELIRQRVYFNGIEQYSSVFWQSAPVTDYLPPEARVVLFDPRALFDDASRWHEDLAVLAGKAGTRLEGLYLRPDELDLGGRPRTTIVSLLRAGGCDFRLATRRPDVGSGEEGLVSGLAALVRSGKRIFFCARDAGMKEKTGTLLTDAQVPWRDAEGGTGPGLPHGKAGSGSHREGSAVELLVADVSAGYVVEDAGLAVVSADDAFPRSRRAADAAGTGVSFDFAPGDHVVHSTHGIALFRDVVRKEALGAERDYLLLEYAQGDRLYVPLEQIGRVSKYVGPDSTAPRLTRLNTADWSRSLSRARKAAKKLAFDLVELYARRAATPGFAFAPDNEWQAQMEADFPFELTPDQAAAIEAVKSDMESDRPMDRLVAGDVGYGKTEVAIRAAFKAVQSGKQVMVLCPTTVLAEQHHTTFSERFEPYGVVVEVLSRFKTRSEQEDILARFSTGRVDVLIGTHRLLSPDVVPKDLGLVVIDEEQRFGVGHKEHFAHMREQIDVLTLSATPIPRTLRMALSGVRDLSVIDTPPPDRFPVEVHTGEYDEDLVQAAIRSEVERGGQVYYVHNRVRGLDSVVERLRELVPEVRIGVGHGRMSERELERVMESFSAGEFDVLVSTTIIESGLDNPHTNTLIIEDSHLLGLAQLYQLKGRVGRSHIHARAYFFVPRGLSPTDGARDRLEALTQHTSLGSGIKIAMRDLEIRGAGSLLGAEQHGNVSAVGFELYADMLREAVAEARGEVLPEPLEIRVDLPLAAFLPEEFVPHVDERVRWYRRLAAVREEEALDRLVSRLAEEHGPLPPPARALATLARVRLAAARIGAESVVYTRGRLVLHPLRMSAPARGRLAADLGAVYDARTQKLSVPLPATEVADRVEEIVDAVASRVDSQ